MNRLRRFIMNGALMAAVTLLIRTVSMAFNVYISNRIGAVSMGLFSLISTVYGFGITFATSGINLATTRIVAEALGDTSESNEKGVPEEKRNEVKKILLRCVLYALFFSGIATVVLFLFSSKIGVVVLRDERTVLPLKVLSLTFVPISVSSVLGGYFSAVRHVYKNAVTQILGQGIKIFACIGLLSLWSANDTESACLAVICGGALSELFSFLIGLVLYLKERKKAPLGSPTSSGRSITKKVLENALPLAFSAYMRSALITIEHILIPIGLEKSGSSRNVSLAAYGTVGSMVFPLVLFPAAISASFAGLLIPEVAESYAIRDERRIKGIVSTVLETVLIFSIGCAGVIMSFSLKLGETVYPEATDAGKYILMIAPLIPVMYLDTAVDAMLKGMGEHVYSMVVNIIDALISVILVAILLPKMGIMGYIVTVYFTEILNGVLSITRLLMKSRVKTHVLLWIGRPLVCIVAATQLVNFLFGKVFLVNNVWALIVVSSLLYVVFLILCRGIKVEKVIKSVKYILKS